ncbi:MAG: DinB family protein [Ignavibacteria bacterium]
MTEKEFFIHRWAAEFPKTISLFKALPENKLDYRPHEKSRSAKEIVGHLIGHTGDMIELIDTGVVNHRNQTPFNYMDEALNIYTKSNSIFEEKLKSVDDKTWNEGIVKLYVGGNFLFDWTFREMMLNTLLETIHHRGQLSSYVRPMGGKNPSIFGPTADTQK